MKQPMQTRAITPVPQSINDEDRTARFTATTEQAAMVWDWERWDIISEVLRMDGVVLPKSGQVPLLDSHSRESVQNILGSARGFDFGERDGFDSLETLVRFADDEASQSAFEKVRGGHLTDVSVGYRVLESTWIPDGKRADVSGKTYEGPVKVATKWELKELSLTPIGADNLAKVRSEYQASKAQVAEDNHKTEEIQMQETNVITPDDLGRAQKEAMEQERTRCVAIREKCRKAGQDDLADDMIQRGVSVQDAVQELFEVMAAKKQPLSVPTIESGPTEQEKVRAAAVDGLLLRSGHKLEKPTPGAEELRGYELTSLVKEYLARTGHDVAKLNSRQAIADYAFSQRALSTSDFTNIFKDVGNIRLQSAYAEAPQTFRPWVNSVTVSDFKDQNVVALSESPNLAEVKEAGEYTYGKLLDKGEKYAPKKYGRIMKLTWETVINDRLDAFSREAVRMGGAAARLESDLVYGLLTGGSNNHGPTMADGVQLFSTASTRLNLLQTGKAINAANLDAGRVLMKKQKGLQGALLDLSPRFLLVSNKNAMTAYVLMNSAANVTADLNSGVINPMQGAFQIIVETRLDDIESGEAWYMIADPGQVDTFEIAYLSGYTSPQMSEREGFTSDTIEWKVRHVFGVGAIDHRGFIMNDATA